MKKILVIIACLLPVMCFANSSLEKAELARIKSILKSTKPLINAAQKTQKPDERIRFRYDWLRADINKVIAGINDKLNAIKIEPRAVEPLKEDYLNMRSSK